MYIAASSSSGGGSALSSILLLVAMGLLLAPRHVGLLPFRGRFSSGGRVGRRAKGATRGSDAPLSA